jgi:hypothetical protein
MINNHILQVNQVSSLQQHDNFMQPKKVKEFTNTKTDYHNSGAAHSLVPKFTALDDGHIGRNMFWCITKRQ